MDNVDMVNCQNRVVKSAFTGYEEKKDRWLTMQSAEMTTGGHVNKEGSMAISINHISYSGRPGTNRQKKK